MNYKALILCLAVISCDAYSKESVSARPISSSKKSRTLKITRTQALRIAASAGKILASIGLISWNFVGNIDHERNVQAITDLHVGIQHLQTPGYIFCSWWFLFSSVAAAIILAKQGITEIYETLKDPEDIGEPSPHYFQ